MKLEMRSERHGVVAALCRAGMTDPLELGLGRAFWIGDVCELVRALEWQ